MSATTPPIDRSGNPPAGRNVVNGGRGALAAAKAVWHAAAGFSRRSGD